MTQKRPVQKIKYVLRKSGTRTHKSRQANKEKCYAKSEPGEKQAKVQTTGRLFYKILKRQATLHTWKWIGTYTRELMGELGTGEQVKLIYHRKVRQKGIAVSEMKTDNIQISSLLGRQASLGELFLPV